MPSLTPVERADRARNALKRARAEQKLDVDALAQLIATVAELNTIVLREAERLLRSSNTNNQMRLRASILLNDASKSIIRAVDQALKLGVKPAEVVVEPVAPEAPDLT